MATVYEFDAPPIKNATFSFEISLVDQDDTDTFKANPTLAAGDVTVNKDGGSFTNIDSLPSVIDAGKVLTVALSADEMNGGRVVILFSDAAGDQWQDVSVTLRTVVATTVSDVTTAQVNAEVDTALNTAIPGSPTADSINERTKAMDDKLPSSDYLKGTADADGGMDTADKADVNAEADTALSGYDGPTKAEMDAGLAALNDPTAASIADAVHDEAVEGTYTLRQLLRLMAAVLAGESSGGGTSTITFRNLGDDTDRVVATVDTSGNRTAVTLDVS